MLAGIKTRDLRKIYTSPPPLASGGGFGFGAARGKAKKQPKAEIVALDGLSLEIAPGEIFGLLGPNGAGKSTTVGVLTTRVRPTGGQAWIGDHDVWAEQVAVKRLIGVVQQRPNLDFSLTAREILLFHGAYFGIDSRARADRAEKLLDRFKLTDRADQMVRGFSGGMMQRLSIARAMMHDPQVLFLDEPSAGLDPQTRLAALGNHPRIQPERKDHPSDHAQHGRGGRFVPASGHHRPWKKYRPRHSRGVESFGSRRLSAALALRPELTGVAAAAADAGGSEGSARAYHNNEAHHDNSADVYADRGGSLLSEIANLASSASVELCDVHISEPSLENLFLHHTGRSLRD